MHILYSGTLVEEATKVGGHLKELKIFYCKNLWRTLKFKRGLSGFLFAIYAEKSLNNRLELKQISEISGYPFKFTMWIQI